MQAFLNGRIGFMQIAECIRHVLDKEPVVAVTDLYGVMEADASARRWALGWLNQHYQR